MYYTYARGANGERFIVPFLLGGLAGSAVVGLSRPRPVFVNGPVPQPPIYGPMPGPGYPPPMYPRPGFSYSSNSYYSY